MVVDEVVCINVGGKIFQCYQNTLTKYKNSIFPHLIYNKNNFKDENNLIFIDRPPQIFEYILNHLRMNKTIIYENKNFSYEYLKIELEFYWLQNDLKLKKIKTNLKIKINKEEKEEEEKNFKNFIFNINYFQIEDFIFGSCLTLFIVFWILKTIYLIGGIIPNEKMNIIFWPIYCMFFETFILTFVHMIKDIIHFKSGFSYFVNYSVIFFLWIYVYLSFQNTYNFINSLNFHSWFWYSSIPIFISSLFCIYSINKMLQKKEFFDIFSTMESLLIHFGPINILMNLVSLSFYLDGYFVSNFWIKIPASLHSLFGSLFSFKTAHECVGMLK